ncbi:MAG: DedA family protein [Patescibacteria group bacterium]
MSFQQIIFLLNTYKYFFLFPVVVIEGPIVTVIAGFLASLGHLNLGIAYAVVIAGDLVGDSMYYAIGYYGGRSFIQRWGRFFGVTVERVKQLERHFAKHSGKTLVIGKLSHAVGIVVLFAAGIAKVPFWKYIWYNFLPTLPKSLILILIGFYFGETYGKINSYLDYTALGTVSALIIFTAAYFAVKHFSKKYED